AKIMHVLMNIDRMVGKDFEIGLANLKRLTEK
ncbi:MAG TPA: polyketide cyclase, partial [Bradyrhizobium sp.]|nr:polyketide cyclase [Bradyrhizobium sp.]